MKFHQADVRGIWTNIKTNQCTIVEKGQTNFKLYLGFNNSHANHGTQKLQFPITRDTYEDGKQVQLIDVPNHQHENSDRKSKENTPKSELRKG